MNIKLIVFFGIVALGVLISTISLTKCKPGRGDDGTVAPPIAGSGNNKANPNANVPLTPITPKSGEGSTKNGIATPKIVPSNANTSEVEVADIANLAATKDYDAFIKLAGEKIPEREKMRIKELFQDPNLQLDPKRPYWEMAKSAKNNRWMLNFIPLEGTQAEARSIQIDLAKTDAGYDITKVVTPATVKEIAQLIKPTDIAEPKDGIRPVDPIPQDDSAPEVDSLTVAQVFTQAVLNQDFVSARQLAGARVTDERIAGLMIALEDGNFSLRQERPLVVAYSSGSKSMVLSRVYSPKNNSEFAITLDKGATWYVRDITFGKVIASLAKDADATYSPIVEDPTGGDSLVVYFDFDNSGLTSRADNQLKIVANILKQDRQRRIRITGHADALGSDSYNRELSQQRASSIRNAIIERGANPEQVITEGYGESKPRKPNFNDDGTDNPQGRTLNRRAEVYLDF